MPIVKVYDGVQTSEHEFEYIDHTIYKRLSVTGLSDVLMMYTKNDEINVGFADLSHLNNNSHTFHRFRLLAISLDITIGRVLVNIYGDRSITVLSVFSKNESSQLIQLYNNGDISVLFNKLHKLYYDIVNVIANSAITTEPINPIKSAY